MLKRRFLKGIHTSARLLGTAGVWMLLFGRLPAQGGPDLSAIRYAYNAVNQEIAICVAAEEEPCNWYRNRLVSNTNGNSWPAVGTYRRQLDFWYQRMDNGDGAAWVLGKLNAETSRSNRKEHEEFLWDQEGDLMFYFFKMDAGEGLIQEARFYFQKGKLIEYLEKISPEEKEYQQWKREDAAKVLAKAKGLQGLFESTCNE